MRVLQINPYPPENLGGSEIFCKNLSINLNKTGKVQCDILTSDLLKKTHTTEYLRDYNINIYYKRFFFNLWGKNPIVFIYNFLRKNLSNYDIIHTHAYVFFTSIQCALLKKIHNFPLITHLHGGFEEYLHYSTSTYEKFQLIFKEKIFDPYIGKLPIEFADAIISVSNKDISIIQKKYKINKSNCFYIPNGVDIHKFRLINDLKREYITFIGRLSHVKGFDIFLKIIKELYKKNKDLKFLVVGDGPLRKYLTKFRNFLPITYFSYYPYEKIENIYNISKIILVTSRFEGLPTSILESLACQTPVISSNVGGISEVISHKKNGFLFELNNYDSIVDDILELINDEKVLKNFGVNGRNQIKNSFSWEKITDQILNVYIRLLRVTKEERLV